MQYHFGEPLPLHPHCACTSGLHPAVNTWFFRFRYTRDLCGLGALGAGGGTGAETVGELAVDGLEVTHAAGAGGLPALGLLAPVDCAALVAGPGRMECLSLRVEQRGIHVHFLVLAAG